MRAINHAMTGAIIGLSTAVPIALPLAIVSHYAMDGLPHHTDARHNAKKLTTILIIDIVLCVILAITIFIIRPTYWWLAILCAFLATAPDFMWFQDYIDSLHGRITKPVTSRHIFVRLHAKVQWFQRPIGIVVEIIWAIMAGSTLYFILK